MKRSHLALLCGLAFVGCSTSDPAAPGPKESYAQPIPLTVSAVPWNPGAKNVGKVQAVTDSGARVVVFTEAGATLFDQGNVTAVDASVKSWTSAATVPASDGGSWTIGVSSEGRLLRMRTAGELEDVSGRWGLEGVKVAEASAIGQGQGVIFRFDGGVAMADGEKVVRFPLAARAASGGGGRAIAVSDSSVCVAKTPNEPASCFPFEQAIFVAATSDGGALVATAHAIHRWSEQNGFERVHDAGGATIHAMVGSGNRVWIAIDRELGLYENGNLKITQNAPIAAEATLAGSASGDVWAIANGTLERFGATTEPEDERIWRETVQPTNARVCQSCHGPPGSGRELARIDLSTYGQWAERRAAIRTRVITEAGKPRAMPPPSSGFDLTSEERDAIDRWSQRTP
jgi:mono/diheme cytochrome c family protein